MHAKGEAKNTAPIAESTAAITQQLERKKPDHKDECRRSRCGDGFALTNVLTKTECERVINLCNTVGWSGLGKGNSTQIRTNSRICLRDDDAAAELFDRVRDEIPTNLDHEGDRWSLYGLNPHFRLCRYMAGEFFARHVDGYNVNAPDDQSLLTFMIYLNDVPAEWGGATRFYGFDGQKAFVEESIQPKAGTLVVFGPEKEHDGQTLCDMPGAVKYILRSDVMYRRTRLPCFRK